MKFRSVAHALIPMIEKKKKKLAELGHLEPVEGVTEWETPIEPVIKSDGNMRICGDFKITEIQTSL